MSNLIISDKYAPTCQQRASVFNEQSTTMLEHLVEMATAEGSASVTFKQNSWVATWAFYGCEPTLIMKSTSPFNAVSQLYAEWKSV